MRTTDKLKFDELAIMAEQGGKSFYAPTAPVAPEVAPATLRSRVAAAVQTPFKALAGGLGRFAAGAIKDPGAMATRVRAYRTGSSTGLGAIIDSLKNAYANIRDKQLKAYYDKLDFPAGWPRKGSKFSIQATTGDTYIGNVDTISTIGDKMILNILATRRGGTVTGNSPRLYVVEMEPKYRAYFSIRKVTVSDLGTNPRGAVAGAGTTVPKAKNVPMQTWIKNEAETGLASHFVTHYDTASQCFVMMLNKTYTCHIPITPTIQGLEKGAKITGKDLITGKDVTGVVIGPKTLKLQDGIEINVYEVEANASS
jgi:hypothetical protein